MTTAEREAPRKPVASAEADAPKAKSLWSQIRSYLPKYFI